MKTIPISKGAKDAMVDDQDYDRLAQHNWFFNRGQIYTKMSFPSGKAKPSSSRFVLKIRMDYYIFNYTPHINARIVHKNGDPYDCQRSNLEVIIKDEGTGHHLRTKYLGVVPATGRLRKENKKNKEPFILLGDEKYYKGVWIIDGSDDEEHLAGQYDLGVRDRLGNDARANFLLDPILPKDS